MPCRPSIITTFADTHLLAVQSSGYTMRHRLQATTSESGCSLGKASLMTVARAEKQLRAPRFRGAFFRPDGRI